jgi:carbon starvation protein CstA
MALMAAPSPDIPCRRQTRSVASARGEVEGNGAGIMRLTLALMLVYLVLTAVLATQVDRAFFINDGVAVAVFLLMFAGLLFTFGRPSARGRR